MEIKLRLDVNQAEQLCSICESVDYDVNVICGRVCVDGKSLVGVMKMCGRVVTLAPVTQDEDEYNNFFYLVKKIGAYKSEGFYG